MILDALHHRVARTAIETQGPAAVLIASTFSITEQAMSLVPGGDPADLRSGN